MRPSRIRLAALITLTVVVAGCASTEVRSYIARGIDLREHRTYNWARDDARATGDPRLDNNRFFQERVQSAVDEQLSNRGFAKTDAPELIVRYHASVTQEIGGSGSAHGGTCDECDPEVYDQGTLVIDLVDAHTDRLLWRGWAKGSIDGVIDNQQWMEQRIDETVARIMRELPRRVAPRPHDRTGAGSVAEAVVVRHTISCAAVHSAGSASPASRALETGQVEKQTNVQRETSGARCGRGPHE